MAWDGSGSSAYTPVPRSPSKRIRSRSNSAGSPARLASEVRVRMTGTESDVSNLSCCWLTRSIPASGRSVQSAGFMGLAPPPPPAPPVLPPVPVALELEPPPAPPVLLALLAPPALLALLVLLAPPTLLALLVLLAPPAPPALLLVSPVVLLDVVLLELSSPEQPTIAPDVASARAAPRERRRLKLSFTEFMRL